METFTNQSSLFHVAEISISYSSKIKNSERIKVDNSKEVFKIFSEGWDHHKIDLFEQFKILLLTKSNRVIGLFEASSGGVSGCLVDPKIIFATAVKACASSIILAHNHPSGNLKPSQADISITKKLKEGGKLLDIEILDHLIVTSEGYYSFADDGMLP
ncbi:DNA repair protein [Pedobacter psychrophilus]|uniref:DNA repair protein n=1 Tax=Pedobacter psychrophilus TaxID=1826909 RepID=A0A179DLM7_9SPHI|nr:JAB domain-containing protein [Pedobacter psychrophilus]OAQ41941.1 DNA repair protein [Pedobacter psychrophilus]